MPLSRGSVSAWLCPRVAPSYYPLRVVILWSHMQHLIPVRRNLINIADAGNTDAVRASWAAEQREIMSKEYQFSTYGKLMFDSALSGSQPCRITAISSSHVAHRSRCNLSGRHCAPAAEWPRSARVPAGSDSVVRTVSLGSVDLPSGCSARGFRLCELASDYLNVSSMSNIDGVMYYLPEVCLP